MDHHSQIKKEFTRQAETLSTAPAFTDQALIERIRAAIAPTETMRILDLGCGPGIMTTALAPMVGQVVAFDLTPKMLQKARQRCQDANIKNVRFQLGMAEKLPFKRAMFDAVVSRLTVHHFAEPDIAIFEMARVTRPTGRVVIADILCSEDDDEAALHNALEILRDPSHIKMFAPSALLALIQSVGLAIISEDSWEKRREFDEWMRIANAPERAAPLRTVMAALAKAGLQAGINLRLDQGRVVFSHRWLLLTAEKV